MTAISGLMLGNQKRQHKRMATDNTAGMVTGTMTVIKRVGVNPGCKEGLIAIDVMVTARLKEKAEGVAVFLDEVVTNPHGIGMKAPRTRTEAKILGLLDNGIGTGGVLVEQTVNGVGARNKRRILSGWTHLKLKSRLRSRHQKTLRDGRNP